MTSSKYGRISDELLSAYIDNAVTEQERNLVEAAVAADSEVAWRLDTLQQTVQLLRSLPELALPRSFALQESQILESPSTLLARSSNAQAKDSLLGRFAAGWRAFWHPGNALYRNLASVSLVLLIVAISSGNLTPFRAGDMFAPAQEVAFSEAPAMQAEAEMITGESADSQTEESGQAETGLAMTATPTEDAMAASAPAVAEAPAEAAPVEEVEAIEESPEAMAASASAETVSESAEAEALADVDDVDATAVAELFEAAPIAPAPPPSRLQSAPSDPLAAAPDPRGGLGGGPAAEPAPPLLERLPAGLADAEDEIAAITGETDDGAGALLSDTSEAGADDEAPATYLPDESAEAAQPEPMPQAPAESEEEPVVVAEEIAAKSAGDVAPDAVAAVPTLAPQPEVASESPLAVPYPAPEPSSRPSIGSIAPMQLVSAGLLLATVVFGGLWWRSRSKSRQDKYLS